MAKRTCRDICPAVRGVEGVQRNNLGHDCRGGRTLVQRTHSSPEGIPFSTTVSLPPALSAGVRVPRGTAACDDMNNFYEHGLKYAGRGRARGGNLHCKRDGRVDFGSGGDLK